MSSQPKKNKMKRINSLLIGLAIIATTLISSCTKEAKIKKNLWDKGGEWAIESLYQKSVSTYTPDNSEYTYYNLGTFSFNEDGNGNYTTDVNGAHSEGNLTYSNTEEKLTLILNNKVRVFDILEWEKNKLKITNTEIYSNSNGSGPITQTFSLKKK